MSLFSQKDLIEAIEKAERRIKREKKRKRKSKNKPVNNKIMNKINRHQNFKVLITHFFGGSY